MRIRRVRLREVHLAIHHAASILQELHEKTAPYVAAEVGCQNRGLSLRDGIRWGGRHHKARLEVSWESGPCGYCGLKRPLKDKLFHLEPKHRLPSEWGNSA